MTMWQFSNGPIPLAPSEQNHNSFASLQGNLMRIALHAHTNAKWKKSTQQIDVICSHRNPTKPESRQNTRHNLRICAHTTLMGVLKCCLLFFSNNGHNNTWANWENAWDGHERQKFPQLGRCSQGRKDLRLKHRKLAGLMDINPDLCCTRCLNCWGMFCGIPPTVVSWAQIADAFPMLLACTCIPICAQVFGLPCLNNATRVVILHRKHRRDWKA